MDPYRMGLIIWVNDIKSVSNLERYGNLIYISKKLKYVILYIDKSEYESKVTQIKRLNFVNKVDLSLNIEISNFFANRATNCGSKL